MRRLILTSPSASLVIGTLAVLLSTSAPAFAQNAASPLRMDGYPAPGAPPAILVLSAGRDPKSAVRVGATTVHKEHMDTVMKMTMSMEAAGMSMPEMPTPAMTVGMDFDVTEVKPNGEVTIAMAMTGIAADPGADPMFTQLLKPMNDQLKGVKGSMTMDARGKVLSQKMDLDSLQAGPFDAMKSVFSDSLKNMAPPMPVEPLGLGARWEMRQAVTSNGMVAFQKTLNEITAIEGDSITIKTTLEQTSPPQTLSAPGAPAGAEAKLEGATATGSGTVTLRAGSLVPAADINMKLTMKVAIADNGQNEVMTMTMAINTKIIGSVIK